MYEVMRYRDEDCPDWGAEEHDFAAAWRSPPRLQDDHPGGNASKGGFIQVEPGKSCPPFEAFKPPLEH